jgi:hypothetical protein
MHVLRYSFILGSFTGVPFLLYLSFFYSSTIVLMICLTGFLALGLMAVIATVTLECFFH